jgi:hypothetical protein
LHEGRRKVSKKLSAFTALMVLAALAVPLSGSASAQATGIDLQPDADTASTFSCNEFTATVPEAGPSGGEVVSIQITQSDADAAADNIIGFCDPDGGGGPATDAGGGSDVDDDFGDAALAFGTCTTGTDGPSSCSFGIFSIEPGTTTVLASVPNPAGPPGTVFQDTSIKTWEAGGPENVASLECTPAEDSNPEGTSHTVECTALSASGGPVANVLPFLDVTGGPNADEIGVTPCTFTGANGVSECTYTDDPGAGSPPGTDTVTVYVNKICPRPGVPGCGPGPDPDETQTTVTKTFHGPARVIDCEPETAENVTTTTHTVTCTVTDRTGNPVPDVDVLFEETGPGRFANGETSTTVTTGADGTASADVTASREEEGDQTITGSLDDTSPDVDCLLGAGDPPGEDPPGVEGVCSDDVTKTWVSTGGKANSRITIKGRFRGRVKSPADECKPGREVVLKKRRPGPNKTVGTDTTGNRGRWRISKPNAHGRFYAKVKANDLCRGDVSRTVRRF